MRHIHGDINGYGGVSSRRPALEVDGALGVPGEAQAGHEDGVRIGPRNSAHVELFVADRQEAASWYRRALGLNMVEECRHLVRQSERAVDDLEE